MKVIYYITRQVLATGEIRRSYCFYEGDFKAVTVEACKRLEAYGMRVIDFDVYGEKSPQFADVIRRMAEHGKSPEWTHLESGEPSGLDE